MKATISENKEANWLMGRMCDTLGRWGVITKTKQNPIKNKEILLNKNLE